MRYAGLTVLAVDDEPAALGHLKTMLQASATVERAMTAGSARDALVVLSHERFDAVFLDVRMPGVDGLAFARLLQRFAEPPAIVFTTGSREHAVEAFEIDAVDYLIKPVTNERLEITLSRIVAARPADARLESDPEEQGDGLDLLAAGRPGGSRVLLRPQAVHAVYAEEDQAVVLSEGKRFVVRRSLAELERRWARHGLVRVHRGHLANLTHAVALVPQLNGTATLVLDDGTELPVSRRMVGPLRRRLDA